MKKIFSLSALLCASLFSLTSCIEENFETPTPANDGDEIIFGARAGFEGSGTKTVYAGEAGYYQDENGKWFERIDWVDDVDAIQIYCTEAGGPNPSNYTVHHSAGHDTENDFAYLSKIGESSLQWKGDDVHHFYAMYPSQALFENMETTLYQGIKMDGTTLHGIVPAAQPATVTQNGKDWVAAPDMKYAYMAAKSTATKENGSVSLSFVPIVTAVQIQMVLSIESIAPITIAEIQVSGSGIAGSFTADLSDRGWPSTQAYPTCSNVDAGNGIITISTWKDNKPVTVEAGGSLTFTVFLRPGADYSNLKVSYSPTGSAYVGKTIGNATDPVAIPRNLKTVIKGFNLPAAKKQEEVITIDASKWMTQVADEVQLKKLSIPGTGGSFTYNYSSGNNAALFRSQHTTMNIPAQWKAGIRAFEIVSDRPNNSGTSSLGSEQITCNKTDVGITVSAAMELINTQLNNNPNECAVVIFTYQPEGNSPARTATYYAQSLKRWYDGITYKDKFLKYTPDLTMGTARGKILVLVRLNQRDEAEKNGGSFSGAVNALSGYPFVLIDGCGTGKDKWGARGYTITNSSGTTIVAPDISNGVNSNSGEYVEKYMRSNYIDPTTHANVRRGDMNFNYSTETDNVQCWYQEWARVVPQNTYIAGGRWSYGSYSATYWFESYSEKLSNAEDTFKMAISDAEQYQKYLFVNSLSGYLATEATKESPTYSLVPSYGSVYGGDGGDIKALADKINVDFYQYVLSAGMAQTTGPTGVVMMDYVTNTPTEGVEYDGAYLLPGVIIANNFKHGSGNGSNTPGEGGGNGGDNNTETPGGGDEEDGW